MLEWILIGLIIVGILTFFYNQANYEFNINQIRWSQKDKLAGLLDEKAPIVLQDVPSVAFWTSQDITMRPIYNTVPVFADQTLSEWLVTADVDAACPWTTEHAQLLAQGAGLDIWTERTLHPLVLTVPLSNLWYRATGACWMGSKGLHPLRAKWTAIFVTEGAIQVSIVPGNLKKSLPPNWIDGTVHPNKLTIYDTPFLSDLKFFDIVLRPGHCLFLPTHWLISWSSLETSKTIPMICTVEYHSPVSKMAQELAKR